jgi:hypothetical protein
VDFRLPVPDAPVIVPPGRAVPYVRAANPADITAITFDPSNGEPWSALETEIPLTELDARGSITEAVIEEVLKLQGNMAPSQIISLMEMGGPTFAMGDHADHIHVGYTPTYNPEEKGKQFVQLLKPKQWERLIGRLGEIENPEIPTGPAKYSQPAGKGKSSGRASAPHVGE